MELCREKEIDTTKIHFDKEFKNHVFQNKKKVTQLAKAIFSETTMMKVSKGISHNTIPHQSELWIIKRLFL